MSSPRILTPKEAFRQAVKQAGFESFLQWDDIDGWENDKFSLTVTGERGWAVFSFKESGRKSQLDGAYLDAVRQIREWLERHGGKGETKC